jgi:hypothetical protein
LEELTARQVVSYVFVRGVLKQGIQRSVKLFPGFFVRPNTMHRIPRKCCERVVLVSFTNFLWQCLDTSAKFAEKCDADRTA